MTRDRNRRERLAARIERLAADAHEAGLFERRGRERWIANGPCMSILDAVHELSGHGDSPTTCRSTRRFSGTPGPWRAGAFVVRLASRPGGGGWIRPAEPPP
jgi:hypothetical protein